ncbi:MAG: hypothetical protein IPP49_02055 [Saprospiraceae bacterium]|nr:hypothetical protein [Saprospiraceae bacterium]
MEVLKRLSRVIDNDIKQEFCEKIAKYHSKTAGQYVYEIAREELPDELNQIALVYFDVNQLTERMQNELKEVSNFRRVYKEYFTIENQKITVKPAKESSSDDLKSPRPRSHF